MADSHSPPPGWTPPSPGQYGHNQYGPRQDSGQYEHYPSSPHADQDGESGRPRGLILGLIAAVALLALIIGGVWMASTGEDDAVATADEEAAAEGEPADEAADGDEPDAQPGADTPHGAVEAYLGALAAGDFDEAFSFVQDDPRGGLLADELLTDSLDLAPIEGIEVEPLDITPDDYSDYVL